MVTCQASGSPRRDRPGGAAAGRVCARTCGSQAAAASTAGTAHTPSAPRQPNPAASPIGTVSPAASAADPLTAIV